MSAVDLKLFTVLAGGPKSARELIQLLNLHPRAASDFLDALAALGLLYRCDDQYANTADTARFLDEQSDLYIGNAIRMADVRLYPFWSHLTDALRTGRAQNELGEGADQFEAIYADADRLRLFASAMTAVSVGPAIRLSTIHDWTRHRVVVDLGTAEGIVPAKLASRYPHLHVIGVDLPCLLPYFEATAVRYGVQDRMTYRPADIFVDPWPEADVYILGHMLHNFEAERNRFILAKVFEHLPNGGSIIVYDAMIDRHRRENLIGLLMSLNMLIETPSGRDYTTADIEALLTTTGFSSVSTQPLCGFDWVASGRKPI